MACREHGGSKSFLCLGFLLVVISFSHGKRLTNLKALDKARGRSTPGRGQTSGTELHHGRLLIGQNNAQVADVKETTAGENQREVNTGYQADMAWGMPQQPKGWDNGFTRQKQDNTAVEKLLKMEPKVECTGDSMKLQVQDAASTPGSLLFVERGRNLSPLPLSKLPDSCGYSIQSTRRDLVLVAPYDGCFVALEEDAYVLPLRWYGLPVRMSCPLMKPSSPNPPMVTCYAEGMVVKTEWTASEAKIKVKLSADWEPLMTASPRCGFSVVSHPEGVVVSVRYAPCLTTKDGMYTLELAGEGETKISCPSLTAAQPESTKSPVKGSDQPTGAPSKGLDPSRWHNTASSQAPPSQLYPYHFPFYIQPEAGNKPATKPPAAKEPPKPETPPGQGQQQVFLQPEPEKKPTDAPKPQQPDSPKGPIYQQFYPFRYPFYPVPKPGNQQAPQPETPPGKGQQQFFPQPEPEKKPTDAPKPQQTDSPKGQQYHQFYPFHYPFYSQPNPPASNPTAAKEPPQPETPPGKGQQQVFLQPEPEKKPTDPPKPQQPDSPKGPIYQQFYPFRYPFYPVPEPGNQQAPQPETPPGKGQQQVFLQPEPEKKPTDAPKPQQPDSSKGQQYQQFYPFRYPFYPVPQPGNQQSPKPETPPGQDQQQFFPQPEPEKKPTDAPKPQQTDSQKGQQYHQFYPFHYPFYSQPDPPAANPTAVSEEPPKPETPPGKGQQQFFPQPESEKPTDTPRPQQTDSPKGQQYPQFYPFHYPFYSQPNPPASNPNAAKEPPPPETPPGKGQQQVFLQPEPEKKPTDAPKPQQPDSPKEPIYQQFYPFRYPFYPVPEPGNQQAPKPETPPGQGQQQFFPQPEPEKKPTDAPKPQQPDSSKGQQYQQFYPFHYPFYSQPDPPASNPTAAKEPPQPETPPGKGQQQVFLQPEPEKKPTDPPKPQQTDSPKEPVYQQFYPFRYPFYPVPEPGSQPVTKPNVAQKPARPETPKGQGHQQFVLHPEPGKNPDEKPPAGQTPTQPDAPNSQTFQHFYPYYFPLAPQPEPGNPSTAKPPAAKEPPQPEGQRENIPQQPQIPQSATSAPATSVKKPPNGPPVYCPQSCPSGLSNCCVQIAFHQHLHHIVPAKGTPSGFTGLPFLPSMLYSDQGLGFSQPPQKPTEATTTKASKTLTSIPVQFQSLPSKMEHQQRQQPPEGNPDALRGNDPNKLTNPQQQIHPYILPNVLNYHWPYGLQNQGLPNFLKGPSPTHKTLPSKPQALQNLNPVAASKGQHQEHSKSAESEVKGEPNAVSVPYNQFHGAHMQTFYGHGFPVSVQTQPSGSDSKVPTKHQPTRDSSSEPRGYVLLQQSPPARELEGFYKSPEPHMPLVYSHNPQHPQNLKLPQEMLQHSNLMQRPDDKSGPPQPFSSLARTHFAPQDPSFRNNYPDFWKPLTPLGSNARVPPHAPKKAFQRRSSAAVHQSTGLDQPYWREGGIMKQN